ncbi:mRNA capping enzyme, putative [Eimeria tenella]|uniref:mRNA guanylyltransferase n=1 Tax=Eimeria tenella TaxID=5802 RepID=U6KIL7_EIMTE|nr:mRNA capping enzyme, putative [Eimeria tenella]CDJ37835.1 mRNA capping enzyme, putative [Eimeria tenella]|eukprot:XP_013228673.1 mRNA capping enzyme, putative [Eimeria tenella]
MLGPPVGLQGASGGPPAYPAAAAAAAAGAAAAAPGGPQQQQQLPPPLPGTLENSDGAAFSAAAAKRIKNRIKEILKWKRDSFPGGQPVSLSMQNITELFRNAYVACEKTDGIRFLLFSKDRRIYLIGRRDEVREISEMYLPRAADSSEAQEETLLDGELVLDQLEGAAVWRFLVYDCISIDGNETIQKLNLLKRLHAVRKQVIEPLLLLQLQQQQQQQTAAAAAAAVGDSLPLCSKPPMEIYLKDFFEIFDLNSIRCLSLRLPHPSDGIIFTPVAPPYITGTSPLLLKWKPPHLNTVDFSVEPVYDLNGIPQIFILCAGYRGVRTFAGLILAPYGDFYKELYELACNGCASGLIVECFWRPSAPVFTFYPLLQQQQQQTLKQQQQWAARNQGHPMYDFDRGHWKEGGWVAERIRTDKAMPNDMRVLMNVKRSIDDGVSFLALQQEIEKYKQHKKPRVADQCTGVSRESAAEVSAAAKSKRAKKE